MHRVKHAHSFKRLALASVSALLLMAAQQPATARALPGDEAGSQNVKFDPVEFLKRFTLGMSYAQIQEALPKNVVQDAPSYVVSDEVFVLVVDIPGPGSWNLTFKFDTLDTPVRRPEQLIEITCSAAVSSRNDPFESIVRKVAACFGEPLQLDRTQVRFQQAGWRVGGGSVLKLEYSIVPSSLTETDASIDLTVKKNRSRAASKPRAVA